MSLWSRVRNVFRGDAVDRELEEELRSHLEEASAHGRDRRLFGSALLHREQSRDVKLLPWLDSLRADIVFGWRQLCKNGMITIAAVLSLGIGIGACTAAFRMIDALLWRPLPVADPHGLYSIAYTTFDYATGRHDQDDMFAYPRLRQFRQIAEGKAELILVGTPSRDDITLSPDSGIERAYRQYLSGNAFAAFGLQPAIGRLFGPADDRTSGGHPVAVLAYDYWSRRFGRDPGAVGQTFRRNGSVYTIIGVCQQGFMGTEPGAIADFFLPSTMMNAEALNNPGWIWFRILARLTPGTSPEQLQAPLQAAFVHDRREEMKRWHANIPQEQRERYLSAQILVQSTPTGSSHTQKNYRQPLLILGCIAVLVLLISCANVANLLTAQAASRAREMALRISIGAGRRRLVQLVLVESAQLALAATVLGALFAAWAASFVVSMINPPDNPVRLDMPLDWRLLVFAALLAMSVTALFGVAPALRASTVQPVSALKGGDTHHRRRWMNTLLASQVAFCVLVLFVAGLFVSTFRRLASQPTGFSADRLLALQVRSEGGSKSIEIWRQIADQLREVPGVESVAQANWALMSGSSWRSGVRVNGRVHDGINPYFLSVSPKFFETMKIEWMDGRDLRSSEIVPAEADVAVSQAPSVAVVNEEFARQFFNGENPVGKSFERLSNKNSFLSHPIVGYVRNARYRDMREPVRPTVYLPFENQRDGMTFLVRTTAANPLTMAPLLRQEVSRLRKEFQVINVQTQAELVSRHTIRERLLATLSVFFAIVALVLAGVGLFGVLSYSVIQRTREIGIRMALGARPANVVRKTTTEVFGLTAAGSALGLAAGIASERYIGTLLFGVVATDPWSLLTPLLMLLLTALTAAIGPALRAVRIDPTHALRTE